MGPLQGADPRVAGTGLIAAALAPYRYADKLAYPELAQVTLGPFQGVRVLARGGLGFRLPSEGLILVVSGPIWGLTMGAVSAAKQRAAFNFPAIY